MSILFAMAQNNIVNLVVPQKSEHFEMYQFELDLPSRLSAIDWSTEYPVLCEDDGEIDEDDLHALSPCLLEEIIEESVPSSDNTAETGLNSDNVDLCDSVTHIEIIKAKTIAPRRVSGANRVVPLITSVWQNNTCKIREPSLASTYRNILYDPDTNDDKECKICFQKLFSSFELEHHVMLVHGIKPSPEQCFVCRKKFIFRTVLKNHLSTYHGIQYPDMICKICFMEFNSSFENKAHERKHEKLIACQFCPLKFASEYFYQSHFDSHLIYLKPFVCNKCGVRCRNNSVLSFHEKRHLHLTCSSCNLSFDNELKLIIHIATHEPEEQEVFLATLEELDDEERNLDRMLKIYTKTIDSLFSIPPLIDAFSCDELEWDVRNCVESLLTSITEPDDVDSPIDKKATLGNCFVCKLCGVEVAFGKAMMEHHRKHHLRNRTCLFCGKRNVSMTQTIKHLATHNNSKINIGSICSSLSKDDESVSDEVKFTKKKVVKSCQSKKNLHLNKSTSNRLYNCSMCLKKFRSKAVKERHILMHKLGTKSSIALHCTICNQIFHRPKFLQKHMLQHNSNYQCETCGKVCMSHTKLRAHLRSHAPVDVRQKFKCSFCSVSCSTFSGLRVHLRIHTGERPYSCNQCKKRFKRLQAMKKHEMLVHGGPDAVLHQCRECPMKFNVRGNLLRHFLLIHRGFRRFICGLCGHRYGQNQDLQRHLKMKHQIDAPSITGKAKKSASDIYVVPSLENLHPSDPHVVTIQQIVDEEKLKFKSLGDLDIMEEDSSEVSEEQSQTDCQEACLSESPEENHHRTVDPPSNHNLTPCVDEVPSQPLVQEETVCMNVQPQFIPLHCLLAQMGKTQCSLTNGDPSTFKLQTCDLCNKLFFIESAFEEHVKKREEHSCSECSMKFCDAEKLQEHVAKEHPTNIIYQCGICMGHFSRTSSLMQQHMQDAHFLFTSNSVVTPPATLSNANCFVGENICYGLKNQLQLPVTVNPATPTLGKVPFTMNKVFLPNFVFQSANTVPTFPISSIPSTYTNSNILPAQTIPPVYILQSPVLQTSSLVPLPPQSVICTPNISVTKPIIIGPLGLECVSLPSSETTAATGCSSLDVGSSRQASKTVKSKTKRKRKSRKKLSDEKLVQSVCQVCGKAFTDQLCLDRHMTTHSGNGRPFACSQCNKAFAENHNLKVHMRTHTGERPYVCEQCGKTMKYQKEYAEHKRKHEGVKPHECKVCGRGFLRNRDLVRHSLLHSSEKRFHCEMCDKRFNRKDHLQTHTQSHMKLTMGDVFLCNYCTKGYQTKSKLKAHLVIHTGEKNHPCPLCKKCFALDDYLKTHLKTHKKQDTYVTCHKCPRRFSSQHNLESHMKAFHCKRKKRSLLKNTDAETSVITFGKSDDFPKPAFDGFELMEMSMLGSVSMLESEKSNTPLTTTYFHTIEEELDQELNISTG